MDHIIVNPIFAALAGWLAFNVLLFSTEKDVLDEVGQQFPVRDYVLKHWDNWLLSLVSIPVLLYVGYKQLNLGMIELDNPQWNELYYLGCGFFAEAAKVAWKKWRTKNK